MFIVVGARLQLGGSQMTMFDEGVDRDPSFDVF